MAKTFSFFVLFDDKIVFRHNHLTLEDEEIQTMIDNGDLLEAIQFTMMMEDDFQNAIKEHPEGSLAFIVYDQDGKTYKL